MFKDRIITTFKSKRIVNILSIFIILALSIVCTFLIFRSKSTELVGDSNYITEKIETWSIAKLQKTANKKYVVSHIKSNVYFGDKVWYYSEGGEPFHRNDDEDENKEIYDDFMNELKARNYDEIEIGGGRFRGEVGILIQINPRADDNGKAIGKARQMFIPGLLPELALIDKF